MLRFRDPCQPGVYLLSYGPMADESTRVCPFWGLPAESVLTTPPPPPATPPPVAPPALWCIVPGCYDFNLLPTNGFSIEALKVTNSSQGSRKHPSALRRSRPGAAPMHPAKPRCARRSGRGAPEAKGFRSERARAGSCVFWELGGGGGGLFLRQPMRKSCSYVLFRFFVIGLFCLLITLVLFLEGGPPSFGW